MTQLISALSVTGAQTFNDPIFRPRQKADNDSLSRETSAHAA
jgi:hypothetical protein